MNIGKSMYFSVSRHAKKPSDVEGAFMKTWVDRFIVYDDCLNELFEVFANVF